MRASLLAKSPVGGREVTLAEHVSAVVEASRALFGTPDAPTPLTTSWLRFFRLDPNLAARFVKNAHLAAAFHDLGKGSDGFQRAVRGHGDQYIRHEHLSGLILRLGGFATWLDALRDSGVDPEIVTSAVVCHHLKAGGSQTDFAQRLTDRDRPTVEVYLDSADIAAVAELAAGPFGVPPPDARGESGIWDFERVIDGRAADFLYSMTRFQRMLPRDEPRKRLLLAVKAAVLAADAAGSAVTRLDERLEAWVQSAFASAPLTDADIQQMVIRPRIEELRAQGRWTEFHDFQLAAGELGPRALLLAGCGSGKTLAAWLWIGAQLRARPARRVLFLYPTRATATEGFRDYVSWAGSEDAALLSGTAPFDLEGMFDNPGDPRHGGDYAAPERLFALGYWHRRVFSATVDSFLAFMAHRYASLCLLPLLADSIVVVDEVHSFDRRMMTALEGFLKFFDVPVLCMTASLPEDRLHVLRDECGLEVFPRNPAGFVDLHSQYAAPRYKVGWTDEAAASELAVRAVEQGKRVLWVVNTVKRCQTIGRAIANRRPDLAILCYHSRFRLVDRRERHEDVIARFRDEALLLVTTQVCEMSLDLDADVLISELAPVPSLIQRMGRCCRKPTPPPGRPGAVHLYEPPGHHPYEKHELEEGREFGRSLSERDLVSQEELADYLQQMAVVDPFLPGGLVGFLDSGWHALAAEDRFREDDDFTVDCVLDTDVDAYLTARKRRDAAADGLVVPAPRRAALGAVPGTYLRVVPARLYSTDWGFRDE